MISKLKQHFEVNPSVLYQVKWLVKTHMMGPLAGTLKKTHGHSQRNSSKVDFRRAVYVLRNPFNAIVAYFNYAHAIKTEVAPRSLL